MGEDQDGCFGLGFHRFGNRRDHAEWTFNVKESKMNPISFLLFRVAKATSTQADAPHPVREQYID